MTQMIGMNGYDLNIWDQFFLFIDTIQTTDDNAFIYETADGNSIQFFGSGFTYDEDGMPTGGQVTHVSFRDSLNNEIASFTLVDASLTDLVAGSLNDFWEVIFAGDDTISASSGDDTLHGYDGDDYLHGFSGDDMLLGGRGDDTVLGGSGNDDIRWFAGDGHDTVDGGSGIDQLAVHPWDGAGNQLNFTLTNTAVTVTDPNDAADRIDATNIETLRFYCDVGPEAEGTTIVGTVAAFVTAVTKIYFHGTWGDDAFLVGSDWGSAEVHAYGGGGDDILEGMRNDDFLNGSVGDDVLSGFDGDDELWGGLGIDVLIGGLGNDTVDGGEDDDTIYFNVAEGDDTIDGGSGFDTVIHNGLDNGYGDIIQVEKINGRNPLVRLEVGSTVSDKAGGQYKLADTTRTTSGRSVIDDKFVLDGGIADGKEPPRNEAILDNVERLEIYGHADNDSLYVDNIAGTDLGNGRIVFDGGAGDDNLNANGTFVDITYVWRFAGDGSPGGGLVHFGGGDEDRFHLIGEADGQDVNITMQAGFGNVEVWEGISGGGLSPDLRLWDVEEMVFDFAGGDDSVAIDEDLSGVFGGVVEIDFGDGEASLYAVNHDGDIIAVGGDVHNDFTSGDGDDTLTGGDGDDYIVGGGGADTIVGGDGFEDELFGGDGNDVIEGGAGYDEMEGGAGADRFVFHTGFGIDAIFDFEAGLVGNDVLDFSSLGITFGDLTISLFNGTDTEIVTPDGDTLYLAGVLPGQLDAGDFLF